MSRSSGVQSSGVVLRPAGIRDVNGVTALEETFEAKERWSESAWASEIEAGNRRVTVAVAGERVVGVVAVQIIGGVADLNRIIVVPDAREQGLGARLLAAGIEAADAERADEMLLEVRHDNQPALALYRRAGFIEIARRAGYYGAGVDAVVLRLDLTEGDDDD